MTRREMAGAIAGMLAAGSVAESQIKRNSAPMRTLSFKEESIVVKRPWTVSNAMIRYLALKPAAEEKVIGLTLVGEDGKRYLLDDVIYGILQVIEKHLGIQEKGEKR